jgi:hypothetical protein
MYECCILQRLNQELPTGDGHHQHGFKNHHSTETALLMLQSYMSDAIENKKPSLLYSVDLSAAFDLLIPDKFYNLFKTRISEGLMFCLMDFLQDRTFRVEMGTSRSDTLVLDRGCVQGSVLGPKIFSLYVGGLEEELANLTLSNSTKSSTRIISYADDTYVLVSTDTWGKLAQEAEATILHHSAYLRDLGMTVNESKTEFMVLGKRPLITQPK